MTFMTTVSVMGGYLIRSRQAYDANISSSGEPVVIIDAVEPVTEQPAYSNSVGKD